VYVNNREDPMNTVSVDNTSFSYACEIGERMPNGAIIVAERITEKPDWREELSGTRRISIVLALCLSKYTPYATWIRIVSTERDRLGNPRMRDFCETGHYHRDIGEAVHEFYERAQAELDRVAV
jgi:hypothetical protein